MGIRTAIIGYGRSGATLHAEYTLAVPGLPDWFVQGDKGTIIVHGTELSIHKAHIAAPEDPTAAYALQVTSEILQEKLSGDLYGNAETIYAEVAQALRKEKPFQVDSQHALRLTRVLDAIKLSHAENRLVTIP